MQKPPFSKMLVLLESIEKLNIELGLNVSKYHYRDEFEEHFGCSVEDYEFFYESFLKNIEDISKITQLDLSHKGLKKIPYFVFLLVNLEYLNLANNQIEILPPQIKNLQKLTELNLGNNKIKDISVEIGQLKKIKTLWLEKNQIKTLPTSVKNLKNCVICVVLNPDLVLPDELKDFENIKLDYPKELPF